MYSWLLRDYKNVERVSCVYRIKHESTNNEYIGRTCNLKDRTRKHYQELMKSKHKNPKMQNIHNKYGDFWSVEVIVIAPSDDCVIYEQHLLDNIDLKESLNCHRKSIGGSDQQVWTNEMRKAHGELISSRPSMSDEARAKRSSDYKSNKKVLDNAKKQQPNATSLATSKEARKKALETRTRNNGGSSDFLRDVREKRTLECKNNAIAMFEWMVENGSTKSEAIKTFNSSWGTFKKYYQGWLDSKA